MSAIKLFYGTVMAGKTKLLSDFLSILQPSEYILIIPGFIYQDGLSFIKTRTPGYKEFYPKIFADNDTDLYESIIKQVNDNSCIRSVFVEEIQFYTKKQVDQLFRVLKETGLNVLCFGINRNHRNEEWDTIKYLESMGCISQEICTKCNYCNEVARTNIRYDCNFSAQVKDCVNDNGIEKYLPCCLTCWNRKYNEVMNKNKGWFSFLMKISFIKNLFSKKMIEAENIEDKTEKGVETKIKNEILHNSDEGTFKIKENVRNVENDSEIEVLNKNDGELKYNKLNSNAYLKKTNNYDTESVLKKINESKDFEEIKENNIQRNTKSKKINLHTKSLFEKNLKENVEQMEDLNINDLQSEKHRN